MQKDYALEIALDIALIRLKYEAPLTRFIQPACLPRNGDLAERFLVAGWGQTETNYFGGRSDVLRKVEVPLVDKSMCQNIYNRSSKINFVDSQICAGGERGKDSCTGDSGGPLMQRDRDSRKLVTVGLASMGSQLCGTLYWPAVYTKIYSFLPWIIGEIEGKEIN